MINWQYDIKLTHALTATLSVYTRFERGNTAANSSMVWTAAKGQDNWACMTYFRATSHPYVATLFMYWWQQKYTITTNCELNARFCILSPSCYILQAKRFGDYLFPSSDEKVRRHPLSWLLLQSTICFSGWTKLCSYVRSKLRIREIKKILFPKNFLIKILE